MNGVSTRLCRLHGSSVLLLASAVMLPDQQAERPSARIKNNDEQNGSAMTAGAS